MCLATGAVHLYCRNESDTGGSGEWMEVSKLVSSDGVWGDNFGMSVSMHDDVIVAGAPYHYNYYNNYGSYTYGT